MAVSLISSNSIIFGGSDGSGGSESAGSRLLDFGGGAGSGSDSMAMSMAPPMDSYPGPMMDTASFSPAASQNMPPADYQAYTPPAPPTMGGSFDLTA